MKKTYVVLIKSDDDQEEAVAMFMNQFETMFRSEFKEFGSVTVMEEKQYEEYLQEQ